MVLHRSRKGFGFVLRGAKATSPLMELTPSARYPALQYLDDVDQGGVADLAGLRKGDYLIQVSDRPRRKKSNLIYTFLNITSQKKKLKSDLADSLYSRDLK